ncbi:GTP-binding protein HSR1 [Anoxybacter fermentans]|uniref:GTP-binding protein HSR1 n=1 Tax=Anoxybacter fermentans TaxID=1323375 RepID=A0A3S9SVG6_9FIRM|nr:GTPase [Anoxybacter fermentans]AZR72269.1 GTP-binding protein HSR1 [Anoxybacter fermentans]
MPANLTPEYLAAEEAYRNAKTVEEKIAALEEMLATIPKHKGTDKMQADIKRRLSKLRKAGDNKKGGSRQYDPYLVEKQGAGQVVLVGFPNSGKSSLVKSLTNAKVKVAPYPFTTPLPQPGMMPYEDILIQLIDTPPITEEGIPGPFTTTIRNGDLLLLLTDLSTDECIDQLQMILKFLKEKRILRKELIEGVSAFTIDECIVIGSKADDEKSQERLEIIKELIPDSPDILPISTETGLNLDKLKELIFKKLKIIRIYSKVPGKNPDMDRPFILKEGSTVLDFARQIHKDFAENLKNARVWGSARFDGQAVPQDYQLKDRDIVELNT